MLLLPLLLSLLACEDEKIAPPPPAEPTAPTQGASAEARWLLPEAAALALAELRTAAASARQAAATGRLADIHPLAEQMAQLATTLPTQSNGIPADALARLTQQALQVKKAAEALHTAADAGDPSATAEALGALDQALAALPAYVCPMHPEVCSADEGTCPKCGMKLEKADPGGHAGHRGAGHMEAMAKTRDALRAALGAAYDAAVPGLGMADVASGKALYAQHCAACHGEVGKGDGPAGIGLDPVPADFTDAAHARYYSDAGRVQIIRKGSPGTSMAGFEGVLNEAQVLDVYAYIASLRGEVQAGGHDHGGHDHGGHEH